jgi:hypothetical protein
MIKDPTRVRLGCIFVAVLIVFGLWFLSELSRLMATIEAP